MCCAYCRKANWKTYGFTWRMPNKHVVSLIKQQVCCSDNAPQQFIADSLKHCCAKTLNNAVSRVCKNIIFIELLLNTLFLTTDCYTAYISLCFFRILFEQAKARITRGCQVSLVCYATQSRSASTLRPMKISPRTPDIGLICLRYTAHALALRLFERSIAHVTCKVLACRLFPLRARQQLLSREHLSFTCVSAFSEWTPTYD